MTVARDAVLESATFTTTTPHTFTFTPVGTPRGIVLFVVYPAAADLITGTVSYGGVTMTRIPTNGHASVTTEAGSVVGYTLGASIPTGAQTVSIGHDGSATVKIAFVASMTAATDTEVAVSGKAQIESGVDPQTALNAGADSALRYCGLFSGEAAISGVLILAGMETLVAGTTHDFGISVAAIGQESTASTGSFTIGFTTAGSESHALIGVAIKESGGAVAADPYPYVGGGYYPTEG